MDLDSLEMLVNATGAAKVKKLGAGSNMPIIEKVRQVLERFDRNPEGLLHLS